MLHQPTSPWRISTVIFLNKIILDNVLNNLHLITNWNSFIFDHICCFFCVSCRFPDWDGDIALGARYKNCIA